MKEGFDPAQGLFAATPARQLYPSPSALSRVQGGGPLLSFLGRMLGKAVFEGVLLELPLAPFFLKKMRGARCDLVRRARPPASQSSPRL